MKDVEERKIWIAAAILLLAAVLFAALFTAGPFGFVEDVVLESPVPVSVKRMALRMNGLGRYTSRYRKLRRNMEESVYFDEVSFDFEKDVVHINASASDELLLLSDGTGCLLYGKGGISIPPQEDLAFIAMHAPILEVTGGQLEYIARYGIEKRLSEVIDLILEIYHSSSYNDRLVGKVKYQGGTGDEFGRLTFHTFGMDSSLVVREKVDSEMVLKSLSVMKEKSRVLPTGETREYELKGNTLTEQKRIVDGI